MSRKSRVFSCIGLHGHERTMIRLLSEVKASGLGHAWRYGAPKDADVIFVDASRTTLDDKPETLRSGALVVAVADSQGPTPAQTPVGTPDSVLRRPIESETVRQLLNRIGGQSGQRRPASPPDHTGNAVSLAAALREVMADRSSDTVWRLSFRDSEDVVILRPARDRVGGSLQRLLDEPLDQGTPVSRMRSEPEANTLLAAEDSGDGVSLYSLLWKLGYHNVAAGVYLFGSDQSASIRLTRWPLLAHSKLSRSQLRALTLLFSTSHRLGDAARATGLEEEELTRLLNGAWLAGDLQVAQSVTGTPQPRASRASGTLLSRIRKRLAAAS